MLKIKKKMRIESSFINGYKYDWMYQFLLVARPGQACEFYLIGQNVFLTWYETIFYVNLLTFFQLHSFLFL